MIRGQNGTRYHLRPKEMKTVLFDVILKFDFFSTMKLFYKNSMKCVLHILYVPEKNQHF